MVTGLVVLDVGEIEPRVQQCRAIVPLPALAGCPRCGMTGVVETEDPVMACSWCKQTYFPDGVLVWVDGAPIA